MASFMDAPIRSRFKYEYNRSRIGYEYASHRGSDAATTGVNARPVYVRRAPRYL
jgi:hypothetical protein